MAALSPDFMDDEAPQDVVFVTAGTARRQRAPHWLQEAETIREQRARTREWRLQEDEDWEHRAYEREDF